MAIVTNIMANTTNVHPSFVGHAVSEASIPTWIGFIGCIVATIFFGSNLVPVKQYSVGDGIFFQLCFCIPVEIVSVILDAIINNQRFFPLAVLGGNENGSCLDSKVKPLTVV
jgi:hypothetical protein